MPKRKSPPVDLEDEDTGGRKRVRIDEVSFVQAAKLQCTVEELAAFFDVSLRTMKRRLAEPKYRDLFNRAQNLGKLSIKRQSFKHMQMANSAGVRMTIHLRKVHLGETDKALLELTGKGGGPIETVTGKMTPQQAAAAYASTLSGSSNG